MTDPEKLAKLREQGIDWIIHFVNDEVCECCGGVHTDEDNKHDDYWADVHTHGLWDNHNHYDLCIVLNIGFESAGRLLNSMGMRILRENYVYEPGIRDDILANNYRCEVIKFDHEDKLYLLLPDDQNRLPGEPGCEAPYCYQREWAEEIHNDNMKNHLEGTHPEEL